MNYRRYRNELTFVVLPILHFIQLTLKRLRWVEEVQSSRIAPGGGL